MILCVFRNVTTYYNINQKCTPHSITQLDTLGSGNDILPRLF